MKNYEEMVNTMTVNEAVDRIENLLNNRKTIGFYVDMEFASMKIEVTNDEYDPLDPVFISDIFNAPPTLWGLSNDQDADYYICIGTSSKSSRRWNRILAITAVMKTVFFHINGRKPTDEEIDISVLSYLRNVDGFNPTLNFIENEFSKNNFNMIMRNNGMVRDLVREVANLRLERADRALKGIKPGMKNKIMVVELD